MEEFVFYVSEKSIDNRIDKFLTEALENSSRSFIQNLISNEGVMVNEKAVKSNYKVKKDDIIKVSIPKPQKLQVEAQDIPLDILYEDSDVAVINKPQGMVVHPAPGNSKDTLVNALLYHCKDLSGINGVVRPGIVHRIDKDTSGVLVIAKNDYSHGVLAEQLKDHSMNREYIALVEGKIKNDEGTINAAIGRNPKDRLKYSVVKGGKDAITHYKVIERYRSYTLISCKLETGRTHQIRVHMAHLGHPLVGDPLYGYKKQSYKVQGQLLHARLLGFIHPKNKTYMEFTAPLPNYFEEIIKKLRSVEV